MFKQLRFSFNRVFPALVVSTMSSGKSTLINALAGAELLPRRNQACTARAVAVLDNDRLEDFQVHMVDKEGKYKRVRPASRQIIEEYNADGSVKELLIEGQVKGIKNSKKALLLVDTPGINNSQDESHARTTMETLENFQEGLILYVINAQQIGTDDDSGFLEEIAAKLRDDPRFHILFVVNKIDLIDPETEDPYEVIQNCRTYIEGKGIKDPTILPVCAEAALIFRKALGGEELSEFEAGKYRRLMRYFSSKSMSMARYAITPQEKDPGAMLRVEECEYKRAEVYAALEGTGILLLERMMEEILVSTLKMGAPRVTFKKENTGRHERKRRKNK